MQSISHAPMHPQVCTLQRPCALTPTERDIGPDLQLGAGALCVLHLHQVAAADRRARDLQPAPHPRDHRPSGGGLPGAAQEAPGGEARVVREPRGLRQEAD